MIWQYLLHEAPTLLLRRARHPASACYQETSKATFHGAHTELAKAKGILKAFLRSLRMHPKRERIHSRTKLLVQRESICVECAGKNT